MKKWLVLLVLFFTAILLSVILSGCDQNSSRQNAGQEIIALERSALDKWAQSNSDGYINICAEDVTWFDFGPGAQQRIDGIGAVRTYMAPLKGQIPLHTYELVNPKVQVYGNTAVLTFHWKGTMTNGEPLDEWKTTSVYNRKDGKWRQVHAHWSVVQAE